MEKLFNPTQTDLEKLNSMTKYPSILTFHTIERGRLLNTLTEDTPLPDSKERLYVTEKVDGTNSRILLCGDDYIIGSREEFLCAKGDRIFNPAQEIVATVRETAEKLSKAFAASPYNDGAMYVVYGESYGGSIGKGAKQYTSKKAHGFRVFDIARVTPDEAGKLLAMERENIASWRDGGGQHFLTNDERREFLFITGDIASEVPYIDTAILEAIPRDDLKATLAWMEQYRRSRAGIDGTGEGNAEGVVIRTKDRSYIRKLRFEDYERTLRKV